jgi:hypothetical protein
VVQKVIGEQLLEDLEISLALDFFRIPADHGLCLTGYVIASRPTGRCRPVTACLRANALLSALVSVACTTTTAWKAARPEFLRSTGDVRVAEEATYVVQLRARLERRMLPAKENAPLSWRGRSLG